MSNERDSKATTAPEVLVQRRETKQDRSANRQKQITDGAIRSIALHGIASVTHRHVAHDADVPLAATTYYYQTKNDIIADASQELLTRYVERFRGFAERQRVQPQGISFSEFVFKVAFNAINKHPIGSLAWCEIIFNTARQPELGELSQSWFEALVVVWGEIAGVLGVQDDDQAVTSAIDASFGFEFVIVSMGFCEPELRQLLWGDQAESPERLLEKPKVSDEVRRTGKKAGETKERILNAAVDILNTEGMESLSFRRVSEKTGLTVAAPAYHFSSISALCSAAQLRILEDSAARSKSVLGILDEVEPDLDRLVDVLTTIFLREATEFRDLSLACYPVYVQARRDPELRAGLRNANLQQWRIWSQLLAKIAPQATAFDAWLMHAIFTGKMIRIMATGADTMMLSKVRKEFAYELNSLAKKRHWSS